MSLLFLHYLKNILYREPSFILKYYLKTEGRRCAKDSYIYMADGKMVHGGLFDRLKGAISIYALSKIKKKRFGIYFVSPFLLEDYLMPNLYDWSVSENNLEFAYPKSMPIIAYSENKHPHRLLKERKGQTHFYFGGDILDILNQKYETDFEWSQLYHELFKPCDRINRRVEEIKDNIGMPYIAIHLRFLNLLGDNMESCEYKPLPKDEQNALCDQCFSKIQDISGAECNKGQKVVILSDSMIFLKKAKDIIPFAFIDKGQIRHIDRNDVPEENDIMKLFSDIYLLAGAEKVFSIVGKGLYHSAFPEYSAIIGNTSFERVSL